MNDFELLEKIQMLPQEQKQQLEDFINKIINSENLITPSISRKPGFAKGLIEILPGFDDPIEGMEEYLK